MGKKNLMLEDEYNILESTAATGNKSKKTSNAASSTEVEKSVKGKSGKKQSGSKKMDIEIDRETWNNLEAYIDSYNKDPGRTTPKTDAERVIHEALAIHLGSNAKG